MSAAAAVETRTVMTETKTFRGSSLEEVLPKIKADLGPDAEIIRQREGLTGGVGGFFQRACIEVEARPAERQEPLAPEQPVSGRRFDAYAAAPVTPEPLPASEPDPLPDEPDEPTAEGLTAPGIQEILRQAAPFADHLSQALDPPVEEAAPVETPAPAPPATARPQIADAIETQLVEAGIKPERAG